MKLQLSVDLLNNNSREECFSEQYFTVDLFF